jgi:cell division initiation protein
VMDNADVTSAREIEASLRERLDLESVAAAREAAETRGSEGRDESAAQATGPLAQTEDADATQRTGIPAAPTGEDSRDTQRIEAAATPTGGTSGARTEQVPAPEVEEPEVDPSSTQPNPAVQQSASQDAATASPGSDVAREVDREEPMPAGEGHTADEFFDEDRTRTDETEERKIFRASRFLRRRG